MYRKYSIFLVSFFSYLQKDLQLKTSLKLKFFGTMKGW